MVREPHRDIWRKSIPARGNSKCKCPDVGVCLACSSDINKVNGTGMRKINRAEQKGGGQIMVGLVGYYKDFGFYTSEKGCS